MGTFLRYDNCVLIRLPAPRPERIERSKRVTVAAGFVCQNGIVLCADSQESAGDYKFPVEKVLTRGDAWTEVAVVGSGYGPLVDMASQRIAGRLLGGYQDYDIIEKRISETLNELYETSFRLYPVRDEEDRIIDLLVAVKLLKTGYPILFHTSATAISRVSEYVIVGSGRAAQYEVQNLFSRWMRVSRGILIAVQLLKVAEAVLHTVGGRPVIVTMHSADVGMGVADDWQVDETAKALRQFDAQISSLQMDFADLSLGDDSFVEKLRQLETRLIEDRHQYRQKAAKLRALMEYLLNPKLSESQKSEPEP
jgi:hypothetical protein